MRVMWEMGDYVTVVVTLYLISETLVHRIEADGFPGNGEKSGVYCNPYRYKYFHPQLNGCKRCDECPLGQELIPWEESEIEIGPHGATQCPSCRPCGNGTYTKRRTYKCQTCKVCGEGQVLRAACTPTSNTLCGRQKAPTRLPQVPPGGASDDQQTNQDDIEDTTDKSLQISVTTDVKGYDITFILMVLAGVIVLILFFTIVFITIVIPRWRQKVSQQDKVKQCEKEEIGVGELWNPSDATEDNSQNNCVLQCIVRSDTEKQCDTDEGIPLTQSYDEEFLEDTVSLFTTEDFEESSLLDEKKKNQDSCEKSAEGSSVTPCDASYHQTQNKVAQDFPQSDESDRHHQCSTGSKISLETKIRAAKYLTVNSAFEQVGKSLGVSCTSIEIIKSDYKNDIKEQSYQVLNRWQQKNPDGSISDIVSAINECGNTEIISKICRN